MICADQSSAAAQDHNILAALAAGKPPPHGRFFFGRNGELESFGRDFDRVGSGGAAMRFIVGDLGSGKTALLDAAGHDARRTGFVTLSAEFSRDRLLHGRTGEGRGLVTDALVNLKTPGTKSSMAMDALMGRFQDQCRDATEGSGRPLIAEMRHQLAPLEALPRGSDFAKVIAKYAGALERDTFLVSNARRWLLAGYEKVMEPRRDLGVSSIVGDDDFWVVIQLWACFVRLVGRRGLVVLLDEARLLSALQQSSTRALNFAQLSTIYNDVFEGRAPGVGIIVAATPNLFSADFNGLCSEPGLGSCFQRGNLIGRATDLIDSVAIRIADLDESDLVAMLSAVGELISRCRPGAHVIDPDDIAAFVEISRDSLGGQRYPLPREIIRRFISLHNRRAESPDLSWEELVRGPSTDHDSVVAAAMRSGEFAEGVM